MHSKFFYWTNKFPLRHFSETMHVLFSLYILHAVLYIYMYTFTSPLKLQSLTVLLLKIQFVEIRCYLSWNRYPVSNNFCDVLKIYKNIQHTFWTFCYCRKEVTSNKNITSSDLFSSMQLFLLQFFVWRLSINLLNNAFWIDFNS